MCVRFFIIVLLFLTIPMMLFGGRRQSSDEFWQEEDNKPVVTKTEDDNTLVPFLSKGFTYAGLMGYANYDDSKNDIYTGGMKISSSLKDYFKYVAFRVDGFFGLGGPVEGLFEADVALTKGFLVGLGLSYTRRVGLSPRLGLYVEDSDNVARRAGFYLLRESSGGIEFSWPLVDKWSVYADIGIDYGSGNNYKRIVSGLYYQF